MQKLVIDTNVIVSALIGKGNPFHILELVFDEKVQVFISKEILGEYVDVLNRERFKRFPNFKSNADTVLTFLQEFAVELNPVEKIEILKDKDDDKFLELAIESNADFLVTGNTKDFTISKIGNTMIVTPAEYWENYKPD
jgi:putative PIN family toxin of toxin-antitoxin system